MADFDDDFNDDSSIHEVKNEHDNAWVNKYRPRVLDDICLDERLKKNFQRQIDSGNIVNCSLIGSAGIGKTTLALILAKSIPNSEVLFISCASGEGKIDTIQTTIIPFCNVAAPGRKFVILDELDSASSTSVNSFQKALRNVVEGYKDVTFIATANYQSNIIAPVLSRLPPTNIFYGVNEMVARIVHIIKSEGVKIVGDMTNFKGYLANTVKSFYPDMRGAINKVQSVCSGGELIVDDIVNVNKKEAVSKVISDFIQMLKTTSSPLMIRKGMNDQVASLANSDASELMDPLKFVKEIFSWCIDNSPFKKEDEIAVLIRLADLIYRVENSIDTETQVFAFILEIKRALTQ